MFTLNNHQIESMNLVDEQLILDQRHLIRELQHKNNELFIKVDNTIYGSDPYRTLMNQIIANQKVIEKANKSIIKAYDKIEKRDIVYRRNLLNED